MTPEAILSEERAAQLIERCTDYQIESIQLIPEGGSHYSFNLVCSGYPLQELGMDFVICGVKNSRSYSLKSLLVEP